MTKIIDSSYLKVTSDEDGKIWVIDGDKMPKKVGIGVGEFVDSMLGSKEHKFVRVLASPLNYPLITKLYQLKKVGNIDSVQIATPLLMQKNRPESSLLRMRLCTLPASLGGFHEVTCDDFAMYTLAGMVDSLRKVELNKKKDGSLTLKSQKEYDKLCLSITDLLAAQPIWSYVSFIDSLDPVLMAAVLTSIGDPRWFINPDRPDRLSKLYSWMGLSGDRSCDGKTYRRKCTELCWYGGSLGGYREYKDFPTILKDKVGDPGCFIVKYAFDKWGPDPSLWPHDRISKFLIKFVRLSWLDCIYPYPNPWMEGLFDYKSIFKSKGSTRSFESFIKKII